MRKYRRKSKEVKKKSGEAVKRGRRSEDFKQDEVKRSCWEVNKKSRRCIKRQ